jgi:hypothetical protein
LQLYVHFDEHQYQDSYIDEYVEDYVITSYVELTLKEVSNVCEDRSNCHPIELIHQITPYTGSLEGIDTVYTTVCRFNNLAANIFEDWSILGAFVTENEAEDMSESFAEDPSGLSGLSDNLTVLYCSVIPLQLNLLGSTNK